MAYLSSKTIIDCKNSMSWKSLVGLRTVKARQRAEFSILRERKLKERRRKKRYEDIQYHLYSRTDANADIFLIDYATRT